MRSIMKKIKTNPPSRAWLKRARQKGFTSKTGPACPLKKKLLKIGGWSVCKPGADPDLQALLTRGRRFPGRSIMMKGEPSQCHRNSSLCWDENREKCRICTGYALTRDGMWRQHSWVITNSGIIVETTTKRVQYFGYILNPQECELFLWGNI